MRFFAGILVFLGLYLSTDWRFIPELWFRVFLKNKHGICYSKFDHFILNWWQGRRESNPERDVILKLITFLSLLLSGILSFIPDNF